MTGGHEVAPIPGRCCIVADSEEAGRGLLLQPLLGVALVDPGLPCELGEGERTLRCDQRVEVEAAPDMDAEQLERPQCGVEQPLG